MKSIIFVFIGTVIILNSSVQAQIPISGFENWENHNAGYMPEEWASLYEGEYYMWMGKRSISRTTDSYSGNYALRMDVMDFYGWIENTEIILIELETGEFNVLTDKPQGVQFHYKSELEEDSSVIMFLFTMSDLTHIVEEIKLPSTGGIYNEVNYSLDKLNEAGTATPLTFMISIDSHKENEAFKGDYLIIDDITFTGSNSIIPNGDFENWNAIEFVEPENWTTSNRESAFFGSLTVHRSDESYSGNYAIEVRNSTFFGEIGFAFTGILSEDGIIPGVEINEPLLNISGYYKFSSDEPEMASVSVFLFNDGNEDPVWDKNFSLDQVNEFTHFLFELEGIENLEYDAAIVMLASGDPDVWFSDAEEVSFIVDDLFFNSATSSIDILAGFQSASYLTYPNPATNNWHIRTQNYNNEEALVSIFDLQGRKLHTINIQNQSETTIDVQMLEKGIYIYNIHSESGVQQGKLIIK